MRVPLVALTLLAVAAPAVAQHEGNGLVLTDLVVTFNPLTQSAEYTFLLENEHTGPTGAIYASVTAHDDMQPRRGVFVDSVGLLSGESKVFTLSMRNYVAVNGCIMAFGTGAGKYSNSECSMTKGATQAPVTLPSEGDLPAPEDLPPAEPPAPPTLP